MSGLMVLQGLATAVDAAGEISQGQAEYNSFRQAERDALAAGEEARSAATVDAAIATEDAERTIGSARTIAGASGFDVSGSARDVLADLAGQKRYNTNALIYGGDLERRKMLQQASIYRASARNARTQSIFRAGATVLTGAYRMSQGGSASPGAGAPRGGSVGG